MPGNKRMLGVAILNVLKEYSDAEHPLKRNDIIALVQKHYNLHCDRKTVTDNIHGLQSMGYEIVSSRNPSGTYFAGRPFEESELRILIDDILFSPMISQPQARELIKKLISLGGQHFREKVPHIRNLSALPHGVNQQIFYTIDILSEAIHTQYKVSFTYNQYGTDFQLHPRREEPYLVSPYEMVTSAGKYYLLCNCENYDNISHFRLDRITDIHISEEPLRPVKDIPGFEQGLQLPVRMAEDLYMYSGHTVDVTLETTPEMMNQLVDAFGDNFTVTSEKDGLLYAFLHVNEQAMCYWILQHGTEVKVLQPESLKQKVINAIQQMLTQYEEPGAKEAELQAEEAIKDRCEGEKQVQELSFEV